MKNFTLIVISIVLVTLVPGKAQCGGTTLTSVEICDNGIDDDNDGLIDCYDPDCADHISCFVCDPSYYQIHSNSTMVLLDPFSGNYTTIGTISGASQINAQCFNTRDGHVYAPAIINGVQKLGRINSDGSVIDMGLELPAGGIYYMGGADDDGNMLLGRGGSNLITIDLKVTPYTYQVTNMSFPGIADIAYSVTEQKYFGVNGAHDLVEVDLINESVNTYPLSGEINNESGGYGAAWASGDGTVFVYNNSSGRIFKINTGNLTTTLVINGTGNLSTNDGFNCVIAPPPFETSCDNGIDDDGDGLIDCEDPDCGQDNLCLVEICFNGIDDDNDGLVDCDDSECYTVEGCFEICDNGIDDNGDGLIDDNDPLCQSGSGGEGGLESNNRLASLISKTNYLRKKEKIQQKFGRKDLNKALTPSSYGNFDNVQFRNNELIKSFMPFEAIEGAENFESTPAHLKDITNAKEVYAFDVFENERRTATVLGLSTEGSVYEHTKYICDRLSGGEINDISNILLNGREFTVVEFYQKNKNIEYAISFSAYANGDNFKMHSHWNLDKYPAADEIYNFQIWANNYDQLIQLAEETLRLLNNYKLINQYQCSKAPRLFVTKGKYQNKQLRLQIKNKTTATNVSIEGGYTKTETSTVESFGQESTVASFENQTIVLDIDGFYDTGFRLNYGDEFTPDDVFFADGSWGYDVSESVIISDFEVSQSELLTGEHDDLLQIERNVEISGSSNENINVYRSLTPRFESINLNQFNALDLVLEGNGTVQITLVKESIEDWTEQPRASINLKGDEQKTTLALELFANNNEYSEELFSDVNMMVFTYQSADEDFDLKISNVRFLQDASLSSNNNYTESIVSPNPVINTGKVIFNSEFETTAEFLITDITGKVIQREKLTCFNGSNILQFNTLNLTNGTYFYSIIGSGYKLTNGKFNVIR